MVGFNPDIPNNSASQENTEDVFDMTNPVPEGVDPQDFWNAVDLLDTRYGGKEKYKPGRPESLHTNTEETYLEKLVRETRQKLPELLQIINQAKRDGVPQEYHNFAKQALEKSKDQQQNTDRNQ